MKIGYILTTFPSITETFVVREIADLLELGFEITVFAADGQFAGGICETKVRTVYRPSLISKAALSSIIRMMVDYPAGLGRLICIVLRLLGSSCAEGLSLIRNFHTVCFFAEQIRRRTISHIHAYFMSWPAVIGLALSAATGCPLSLSAHARDIFVESGAVKLKVALAKFVRTCTRHALNHLKANLPAEYHHKLYLVYHGVRVLTGPAQRAGLDAFSRYHNHTVIAVGRLVPKKGFSTLLRAFALVVREKPGQRLIIAGEGPERKKLRGLIESLALGEHVELLGRRYPDETRRLIRQAALLVVPSTIADDGDRDGIPNVILEAFSSSVAVIASDMQGITEAIEDGRNGLLVRSGDVVQLAAAIVELLNNKPLRDSLARRAYETAVRRFDSVTSAVQIALLFVRADNA